jgi:ABC-type nitrate/sulfonate/bicarbonate transport system substrate-binding protein
VVVQVQHVGAPLIMPAEEDVPSMRGEIQAVMYVRPDVLAKREDAVVAFVKAVALAESFIRADRDRARTLLKQYTTRNSTTRRSICSANRISRYFLCNLG